MKTGSTTRCIKITVLIYWEKLFEKNYFTNLNIKDITDSKTFWKTIKPDFNEKGSSFDKIIVSDKGLCLTTVRKLVTWWINTS